MINARLILFGAGVSSRDNAHQVPNSKLVQHQRSPGVALSSRWWCCSERAVSSRDEPLG